MVKELIINIVFIFMATNILYYCLNNEKIKRIKVSVILGIVLFIISAISTIIYKSNIYLYITISGILQFTYEVICFGFIINTIYDNKKKLNLRVILDKKEKSIIIIAVVVGLAYLLTIALTNIRYILPFDEHGMIGNVYFNADVHRVQNELLRYNLVTSPIHPLYRFINLPISLVISVFNIVIGKIGINSLNTMIIDGYIYLSIQVILNAISSLILYRILKKSKIKDNLCIIGTMLFIFSLSFIWLSIIPETYSITLLTLLLMVYFYQTNRNEWTFCAILALGSNLIAILPIGIIVLDILIKNIKSMSKKQKRVLLCIAFLLALLFIPIVIYSYNYISCWSEGTLTIGEKLSNSINKVVIPIILGPEFININPFFVQVKNVNIISLIIVTLLFINVIIGYIANAKKNIVANICMAQLIVGYMLHAIVGYRNK